MPNLPTPTPAKGEPILRKFAVGLARCSREHQDHSVEDQITALKTWAEEQGCELLQVFEDDGVSGSELDRPGIRQLMHFLKSTTVKGTLVAWKRNRLARPEDPRDGLILERQIEKLGWGVHYLYGAQPSGNQLVDTLMGVIEHHEAGQFLKSLACDSLRGQAKRISDGSMGASRTPYGYAKQLTSTTGRVRVIPRGEPHRKLREEVSRLIAGDADEVALVRRLFKQAATGEMSAVGFACQLNVEGVPSPTGGQWSYRTVQNLLRNRTYQGDQLWNVHSDAKFFRLEDGKPVPAPPPRVNRRRPERKTRYRRNDPRDWVILEDRHDPLVSKELFARANAAMAARASRPPRQQSMQTTYPLSGMVFCGNCGGPMTGRKTNTGRKAAWQKLVYQCRNGTEKRGCVLFSLRADRLEPRILEKLREHLIPEERGEGLKRAVAALVGQRMAGREPRRSGLQRDRSELEDLNGKISQAVENLGRMRGRTADLLAAQIEGWAAKAEEVEAKIQRLEKEESDSAPSVEEAVAGALELIDELEAVGMDATPTRRRALFRRVIRRLEIDHETMMVGKRKRHMPVGGRLVLLDSASITQTRLAAHAHASPEGPRTQPGKASSGTSTLDRNLARPPDQRRRPTGGPPPRTHGPRPG